MPDITSLILENEKLIYKSASYFKNYGSVEDLYQAGVIGIMQAYKNYDPNSKAKFTTYAYSYILGEMKSLVRSDKGIKVSRDITRLRGKIENVKDKLSQTMMREPTVEELSYYLDIPEYYIAEALNSNVTLRSIDESVGDTNMSLHEVISTNEASIDDLLYLKAELEHLEEPERSIMMHRYYEDMTQRETAENLGLTQVDVSRREGKVITKLRQTV